MARVILLHGKSDEDEYFNRDLPSASSRQWFPWLQNELLIAGHDVQAPEVFRQFEPNYPVWRGEFERHVSSGPMLLVGHSCGAGFLLRWLSENPHVHLERLLLVAPWLDPGRESTTDFFGFELDATLPSRVGSIHLFHSTDDFPSITATTNIVLSQLMGVIEHRYSGMGHFTTEDMHTDRFPDLLAALL